MLKTTNGGLNPTAGTKYSAAVDLYPNADMTIEAGQTALVPLGVIINQKEIDNIVSNMEVENNPDFGSCRLDDMITFSEIKDCFLKSHYLQLMIRSGASKHLIIANGIGIIDLDFPNEIMIRIHNPLTWKTASNIAIKWINDIIEKIFPPSSLGNESLSSPSFDYISINRKGFDHLGGFIVKKACNVQEPIALAQIMLKEHKTHLLGITSKEERDGGFGSTNPKGK